MNIEVKINTKVNIKDQYNKLIKSFIELLHIIILHYQLKINKKNYL